nr:phospholipase D beta 1-like [Tanacetum cinerariifolium]
PYTPRCIQNFRKAKDHDIKFYCSNAITSKIKILDHKHAKGTAKNSQDNKVLRREELSIASQRFMIHVNSKGMIVDDKFGMLGSANINQCSLEGQLESTFDQLESLECVKRMWSLGEQNWEQYAANKVTNMTGYLLNYSVEVDCKGQVKPLPGSPNFLNVGGSIGGSLVSAQENLTI